MSADAAVCAAAKRPPGGRVGRGPWLKPRARLAATVACAFSASIIGGNARAQPPAYVGNWAAEPARCTNLPQSDQGPEIIEADAVFGWEYSCDIAQIDPTDFGTSWRVRLDCLDAGFKETWDELWFITADDRLMRIDTQGYYSVAHRCPAPQQSEQTQ